jgi:hypothetical protein
MKNEGMPEEVKKYLREQLKQVASKGGKARWKDVSKEDRRRLMSAAGRKSGQVRRAKSKKKG